MAEEGKSSQILNVPENDHGMGNGTGDGDGDDIFKSAIESPMTDSEQALYGNEEIDLNDDDGDDDTNASLDISGHSGPPTVDLNTITDYQSNHQLNNSANLESQNQEKSRDEVSSPVTPNAVQDIPNDQGEYMKVTVTDPQKQGDGMSAFIVYRVTTRTNITIFRSKDFSVWRRFSDFLGLHHKLAEKYLKKGRIVPPAPEKNMIDTTKIKVYGQTENASAARNNNLSGDFVERRRCSIERFLNRIASHPVLRVDPDFRDFLEVDTDLPKATSTSAFSGAGVVRLFNKVGKTVNQISYRMDEADPWFTERFQNVEALENQLRNVHTSIELLVTYRRGLAAATSNLAKSAAILGNAEEHIGLARALAQLSDVWDKVEHTHNDQANSDFFLLSEVFRDYIFLIGCVKDVFHERMKANQTVQHAELTLHKKREARDKLELAGKNDKVAQAREEIVEWEEKVERSQAEFASISSVIKKELEFFETARVKEFKAVIINYMESLLVQQQDLLKHWEEYLPETKAIQ